MKHMTFIRKLLTQEPQIFLLEMVVALAPRGTVGNFGGQWGTVMETLHDMKLCDSAQRWGRLGNSATFRLVLQWGDGFRRYLILLQSLRSTTVHWRAQLPNFLTSGNAVFILADCCKHRAK